MLFKGIKAKIKRHPSNSWAMELGYEPLFAASEKSKIVIIGQAPGIRAQLSKIPWNDFSGNKLREWLNVSNEEFYNPENFALVPMDFYYPGKGKNGDLPPRKDFHKLWHNKIFNFMPNIKLKILVGSYAQMHYLENLNSGNLTYNVENFKTFLPEFFPLPHPSPRNGAWFVKNKWFAGKVIPELHKRVRNILEE